MRERGAGTVGVVVLVVVVLACIGFVIYYVAGSSTPEVQQTAPPDEAREYKCANCGWTKSMTYADADAMVRAPGSAGASELLKCPKCAKFSVGKVTAASKSE